MIKDSGFFISNFCFQEKNKYSVPNWNKERSQGERKPLQRAVKLEKSYIDLAVSGCSGAGIIQGKFCRGRYLYYHECRTVSACSVSCSGKICSFVKMSRTVIERRYLHIVGRIK